MVDKTEIKVNVKCEELDLIIEKANKLVGVLKEAEQIICSLSGGEDL